MKDKLFILGKIIGLLVFVLAFSLIGVASGNPLMILAYAGFFLVVMLIIFLFVRRNQRHFEIISQTSRTASKIIGIIMILLAISIPPLAVANMQIFDIGVENVGLSVIGIVLALTIALIAGGVFAVYLINRNNGNKIIRFAGYLLMIILSAIPALFVIPNDKTTTGIGSVYYLAVLVALLSWWGFSLYLSKE